MKPYVTILLGFGGQEHAISFEKIEEIDDLLSTLEDARAELEHQIEMEKQRKRDKRKRAKMRRKASNMNVEDMLNRIDKEMEEFDKLPVDEKINNILRDYESLDGDSKEILRPLIDIVKRVKKNFSLIKENNE